MCPRKGRETAKGRDYSVNMAGMTQRYLPRLNPLDDRGASFAGKPAPTVIAPHTKLVYTTEPVGAGLPAIGMGIYTSSRFGVHIHYCGNGHLGFRPYGGSLGKAPSNQGLLPLSFGASPRLGIPSLRSCSVGPPRSAIHGRARLTRHPCRVAHCAEPALGLSRGRRVNIKSCRRANARPVEW
jgi:hypothetical protein